MVGLPIDTTNEVPGGRCVFRPLYYPELLHAVNPSGDVGLLTLWTPFRTMERKLNAYSPAILDTARSRVAVAANLYGDGLYAMFCNLLFNPQISHLVAIGEDLGLGVDAEIEAFIAHGLEDATMLGRPVKRIRGTPRLFPAVAEFDEMRLRARISFHHLGKLSSPGIGGRVEGLLNRLPRVIPADRERVRVAIPTGVGQRDAQCPSDIAAHQVMRRGPLDCWEELVVRVVRFGRPIDLRTGPHLELLNARAVLTDPFEDPPGALEAFGFDPSRLRRYQERILRPELPDGIAYTYGNRLRSHFGEDGTTDTLASVAIALRQNESTRRAFVTVWDNDADLAGGRGGEDAKPCLTTLCFRVAAQKLTLTATFRAQDLLTAWLENVYGLMAIQRHVGCRLGIEPGSITVISHSLCIDRRNPAYSLATGIADRWRRDDDLDRRTGKSSLRHDPNGYFIVTTDGARQTIVAEHRFEGVLINRYEGSRASSIERQVSADMAVSLTSHAMWLGRELARAEQALESGTYRSGDGVCA
jgi:hypothetical protein